MGPIRLENRAMATHQVLGLAGAADVESSFFRMIREVEGWTLDLFDPTKPIRLGYLEIIKANPKLVTDFDKFTRVYAAATRNAGPLATSFARRKTAALAKKMKSDIDTALEALRRAGSQKEELEAYEALKKHIDDRVTASARRGGAAATPPSVETNTIDELMAEAIAIEKRAKKLHQQASLLGDEVSQALLPHFPESDSIWREIAEKLGEPANFGKLTPAQLEGYVTQIQGLLAEKLVMRHPHFVPEIIGPMWRKAQALASRRRGAVVELFDRPVEALDLKGHFKESYDVSIWIVDHEAKTCTPVFVLQVKSGKRDDIVGQIISDLQRESGGAVRFSRRGDPYRIIPPEGFDTQRAFAAPYVPSWEKLKQIPSSASGPIILPFGLEKGATKTATGKRLNIFGLTATDLREMARRLTKS